MTELGSSNLMSVLQRRLDRLDGARTLALCTSDGAELITVSSSIHQSSLVDDCQLMSQYYNCASSVSEQICKFGLGDIRYSMSWIGGGVLVQCKIEAAFLSIYLNEDANLGLLPDHLELFHKILQPFTTANFISTNI